ncbi:MAG: hypothetical protein JSV23_05180 [Promethearchaeota archaeon]|nr:MAG: hypothetical protein JSV23_05180 [Candidatus Lokiarchaeota archaeon]
MIIIIKSILEKLKDKRISVYVKDVTERSWFSGVLEVITDENVEIREKTDYSECRYYIPISEIVVVSESLL